MFYFSKSQVTFLLVLQLFALLSFSLKLRAKEGFLGIKPLSVLGIVHSFQEPETLEACAADYPRLFDGFRTFSFLFLFF